MNPTQEAKKRVLSKIIEMADAAEGNRLKKRKSPEKIEAKADEPPEKEAKGQKTGDEDEEADDDKRRLMELYEKMK